MNSPDEKLINLSFVQYALTTLKHHELLPRVGESLLFIFLLPTYLLLIPILYTVAYLAYFDIKIALFPILC